MAIATSLPAFKDLRRSVTPIFFPETDFIYSYLHIVQKWTKNQCGKLIQDFCHLVDLPQVDLFLILDLLISLERSERVIFARRKPSLSLSPSERQIEWRMRERERRSRERSTCFACREVSQSPNFWREKHDWHSSDFTRSARDPLEGRKWRRGRRPKRFESRCVPELERSCLRKASTLWKLSCVKNGKNLQRNDDFRQVFTKVLKVIHWLLLATRGSR